MPGKMPPHHTDFNNVLDQLERVVQWSEEFQLVFVKCNHPIQQEALRRAFFARLHDKRVLEVVLEQPIVSLLDEITARWDSAAPPQAVCVYHLEKSINEQRETSPVLGRLNHDRDLLRRAVPATLLLWLPDFALDCVARGAPDFWAWRSGVYEFPTDTELWHVESTVVLTAEACQLDTNIHLWRITTHNAVHRCEVAEMLKAPPHDFRAGAVAPAAPHKPAELGDPGDRFAQCRRHCRRHGDPMDGTIQRLPFVLSIAPLPQASGRAAPGRWARAWASWTKRWVRPGRRGPRRQIL